MSLNCPTSPVYSTTAEQKRRGRDAAKKRFGTPKFLRDLLREKCRIRFHEARQDAFQKTRKLCDEILMEEILRQQLAELEKDVELQSVIYEELKTEANEWFATQLEEEQNYLIDIGNSQDLVCPVCQKATLDFLKHENMHKCSCGTSFLYTGNSTQLSAALQQRVTAHGQNCEENLLFFVEPYDYANGGDVRILNAMCDLCDYFVSF